MVYRTCARLHEAFAGTTLTVCDLRWPGTAQHRFMGCTMREVVPVGKYILMRLSSAEPAATSDSPDEAVTIRTHLRMEGSWRVYPGSHPTPPESSDTVRVVIGNGNWLAVGYRLGMVDVVPTAAEYRLLGHLGPDILAPDFSPEDAAARVAACGTVPVGAALLDQRVLAGVGTFFMAEMLYVHGVGPWVACADVTNLARILRTGHAMMRQAVAVGVQVTTGDTRPGRTSYVHARSGRPCHRCGTTVRVAGIDATTTGDAALRRIAFYCPTCQPGPTPTDDGCPQAPLGARRSPRHGGPGGYWTGVREHRRDS